MASIYTRFASGVLFPLHEKLKGHHSVAMRRQLERTQWWSAEQLRQLQLERLRAFVGQVYQRVPYYRRVMEQAGLTPEDVRSVDDLRQFPILTKKIIRENVEELKARDAGRLTRYNTGGSSGEPLVFFIGNDRVSHDVAAKWRATRWWDVDIGDREIVVWGSPIELGAQDRIRGVRDKLFRSRLLPAFEMSAENLNRFVNEIRKFRPAMLFGYPSSLSMIARHARERGVFLADGSIKVAFVTSERLYDEQKAVISEVFGCPVANGYGGRDAGFIAHQCPQGGMHITSEDIIVELIDQDGNPVAHGDAGEVVITHLHTQDFPFIRYRTGDVAVMGDGQCACGRGLPVLKEIQGRTTDFILAKDGTVMHGLALIYVLRDLPGIASFKVVQESLDETRVMIVRDADWNPNAELVVEREFKKRLGQAVRIRFEYPEMIAGEKSGKFRYVISKVM